MREMVLNHASIKTPDKNSALEWLRDLQQGMVQIIGRCVANSSLSTARHLTEICCLPNWSLFSAIQELRNTGFRDESLFLLKLGTKTPLLKGSTQSITNRFHGCEHASLAHEEGEPLLYCALVDGISVGFPSETMWDKDQLKVEFNEIAANEAIEDTWEIIDNLTRVGHAKPIID